MGVQLEKGVCDLQHENVRVVVVVAYENAFASPPHAILNVVLFQTLQAGKDRGVFLGLRLFCAKGVVAQRI